MSFLFKVVAVGLFNTMLTITWLSLKGKHQLGHFLFNQEWGHSNPLITKLAVTAEPKYHKHNNKHQVSATVLSLVIQKWD